MTLINADIYHTLIAAQERKTNQTNTQANKIFRETGHLADISFSSLCPLHLICGKNNLQKTLKVFEMD